MDQGLLEGFRKWEKEISQEVEAFSPYTEQYHGTPSRLPDYFDFTSNSNWFWSWLV